MHGYFFFKKKETNLSNVCKRLGGVVCLVAPQLCSPLLLCLLRFSVCQDMPLFACGWAYLCSRLLFFILTCCFIWLLALLWLTQRMCLTCIFFCFDTYLRHPILDSGLLCQYMVHTWDLPLPHAHTHTHKHTVYSKKHRHLLFNMQFMVVCSQTCFTGQGLTKSLCILKCVLCGERRMGSPEWVLPLALKSEQYPLGASHDAPDGEIRS